MLSPARRHVIERGINTAADAKFLTDRNENRLRRMHREAHATRQNAAKALEPLCAEVDRHLQRKSPINQRFLTPAMVAENTRLALQAVTLIEQAYARGEKPPTLSRLAELLNVEASRIRLAVAQVFACPDPSYPQLVSLCNPHRKEKKKGAVDLADEAGIAPAVEWIMCHDRFPTDAEARELMDCTAAQLKRRLQKTLVADLQAIVTRFAEKGFGVNDVVLNRYSYYYREYGIRIYYLLFGAKLETLFKAIQSPAEVNKGFQKAFEPEWNFNLYEQFSQSGRTNKRRIQWITVPDALIEELENVTDRMTAFQLVQKHCGFSIRSRNSYRVSVDHLKTLLKFWNQHRIHFAPQISWFDHSTNPEVLLAPYRKLLPVLDQLALPFKTRTRLLNLKLDPEELLRRVKLFESYGLPAEYFVPYLVVLCQDDRNRKKYITRIRGAICVEARMNQMRGSHAKAPKPEHIFDAPPDRLAALKWLTAHDYDYEDFASVYWRHSTPESCGLAARLFAEAGLRVSQYQYRGWAATTMPQRSLALADRLQRKTDAVMSYRELVRIRGLSEHQPSDRFRRKASPRTIVDRVESLEQAMGRPLFTRPHLAAGLAEWAWIERYLSPRVVGMHLARRERQQSRGRQLDELDSLYGLSEIDIPGSFARRNPKAIWQHFRFLKSVDIDPRDPEQKGFFAYTIPRVPDQVFKHLSRLPAGDLTDLQQRFVAYYRWADKAHGKWGWPDAHALSRFIQNGELARIDRGRKTWHVTLRQRAKQYQSALNELLSTPADFGRMEALLDNETVGPARLLECFAVFDELKKPVLDTTLLFQKPADLRRTLMAQAA